ncbi:roadblock/LC7 domain-containing protein [Streptomyces sp. SGAir0957]
MIKDSAAPAVTRRSTALDGLLDAMAHRVPELRHALVLSNDGLPAGASSGLGREDAEHLSAVASGFNNLAKGTGRRFGTGGARLTMVEMDGGFLFVAATGGGSCLAVLSDVTADIGLVAYEMARLVDRIAEHLRTGTGRARRSAAAD